MNADPNVWTRAKQSISIVCALVLMSASSTSQTSPQRISTLFSRGYFDQTVAIAPAEISRLLNAGRVAQASQVAVMLCRSKLQLGRYDEADRAVDTFLANADLNARSPAEVASLYFCKASISRAKRDFKAAFKTIQMAVSKAPLDSATLAGYQLEVGRTLYSAGHDFAAIVWLEKAEKEALASGQLSFYYDALRFLSLAWSAKSYYANALNYAEKLAEKSSNGEFEHRNRIAYLELANLLETTGQEQRATTAYQVGLRLSRRARVNYHAGQFLSALFHRAAYRGDTKTAEQYLRELESIDSAKQFTYECLLGNALVAHYRGNKVLSEEFFAKLKSEEQTTEFVVPYWKSTIAEREQNWNELINQADFLRRKTEESRFEDDLPGIYYKLALGSWRVGDKRSAKEYALKSLSLFEPLRNTPVVNLSIGMIEVHHSVYRLLSEIEAQDNPEKAFEYSERLKAGLLRDRIDQSRLKTRPEFSELVRSQILAASQKVIEGADNDDYLFKIEKGVVSDRQDERRTEADISTGKLYLPDDATIISYEFIPSGDLIAYVIEGSKPLRVVKLDVTGAQISKLAIETQIKIKDRIFFKADGKALFDLLLGPLKLTSRHLVIVPDKLLWRIPFQAMSPDGKKYLIETSLVSYSPSVHVLRQLSAEAPPERKTIQIFANDSFNRQKLAYVNTEAASIGKLFGISPRLSAVKSDFIRSAADSDILHFSMHAQVDGENPLASFLAFQQDATDTGRVTVNDLLSVRLKPKSLVFLASCDTSRVSNGEGLISIPWAMLGSGSSAVISSQWEANDRSTQKFSQVFYKALLKGSPTAIALQAAAIEMINDKSSGFHEPYFWGGFTLSGDFR